VITLNYDLRSLYKTYLMCRIWCATSKNIIVKIGIIMSIKFVINVDRMEETIRLRRMLNPDGRKCERRRGKKRNVLFL